MIKVHVFSDQGKQFGAVYDSLERMANLFFSEQQVRRAELVSCQLASLPRAEGGTEAALLVVVDVREAKETSEFDEAMEEAMLGVHRKEEEKWSND